MPRGRFFNENTLDTKVRNSHTHTRLSEMNFGPLKISLRSRPEGTIITFP